MIYPTRWDKSRAIFLHLWLTRHCYLEYTIATSLRNYWGSLQHGSGICITCDKKQSEIHINDLKQELTSFSDASERMSVHRRVKCKTFSSLCRRFISASSESCHTGRQSAYRKTWVDLGGGWVASLHVTGSDVKPNLEHVLPTAA